MRKLLPVILLLVSAFTISAFASAPYEIFVTLEGTDSLRNSQVIANPGDHIKIQVGSTQAELIIGEPQEEGLNFQLSPSLEYKDEQYGIVDLGAFLLPEGDQIQLSESGKDDPVIKISWKPYTLDPLYEELITRAAGVLSGSTDNGSDDFSMMFSLASGSEYADNFGYTIRDVDGNGIPELLFGEDSGWTNGTVIYDMYTIKNGNLVRVFDGWDRSRYYLCSNGWIAHAGSSSAFQSFTAYHSYVNGELRLLESVIYDSNTNPDNPWRLSMTSEFEAGDSDQKLSEAEAQNIMNLHPFESIRLEAFIK